MKTVKDQIQNTCIHFTGISNTVCRAGVKYADAMVGKPIKLPCLNQGGECTKSQFPTDEEARKQAEATDIDVAKALYAYAQIKKHTEEAKEKSGKLTCRCGGELHYQLVGDKNHIWAVCQTCGINIGE